jgi:hypothetical protein
VLNKFVQTICIPGALSADYVARFIAPSDCTLVHVSAYCTTQNASLKIGTPTDDDAFLETATVTSSTDTEIALDDFVDGAYPRIEAGDAVIVTVGHGSNCVDFTCVLTFLEG